MASTVTTSTINQTAPISGRVAFSEALPWPILGMLEPPRSRSTLKCDMPSVIDDQGNELDGIEGKPVRAFPGVPNSVTKDDWNWAQVETWWRLHGAFSYKDMNDRRHPWGVAPKNNLNMMRRRNGRSPLNCLEWSERTNPLKPSQTLINLVTPLSPVQIAHNTSWVVTANGIHPPGRPTHLFALDIYLEPGEEAGHRPSEALKVALAYVYGNDNDEHYGKPEHLQERWTKPRLFQNAAPNDQETASSDNSLGLYQMWKAKIKEGGLNQTAKDAYERVKVDFPGLVNKGKNTYANSNKKRKAGDTNGDSGSERGDAATAIKKRRVANDNGARQNGGTASTAGETPETGPTRPTNSRVVNDDDDNGSVGYVSGVSEASIIASVAGPAVNQPARMVGDAAGYGSYKVSAPELPRYSTHSLDHQGTVALADPTNHPQDLFGATRLGFEDSQPHVGNKTPGGYFPYGRYQPHGGYYPPRAYQPSGNHQLPGVYHPHVAGSGQDFGVAYGQYSASTLQPAGDGLRLAGGAHENQNNVQPHFRATGRPAETLLSNADFGILNHSGANRETVNPAHSFVGSSTPTGATFRDGDLDASEQWDGNQGANGNAGASLGGTQQPIEAPPLANDFDPEISFEATARDSPPRAEPREPTREELADVRAWLIEGFQQRYPMDLAMIIREVDTDVERATLDVAIKYWHIEHGYTAPGRLEDALAMFDRLEAWERSHSPLQANPIFTAETAQALIDSTLRPRGTAQTNEAIDSRSHGDQAGSVVDEEEVYGDDVLPTEGLPSSLEPNEDPLDYLGPMEPDLANFLDRYGDFVYGPDGSREA